jgi:crotonobetainyl-CoA:carnitine CoA-transferase CaiB-like acyl-CoA transferase
MASSAAPGPLDGVLVVEVANWIAAPCCGALLADLGATVVKVEAPNGDSMR